MKPGKLALLRFPHVDLEDGKLRPVLLIACVPGDFPDWLVAMVSSRLEQAIPGVDEVIKEEDADFSASGLIHSSCIRRFLGLTSPIIKVYWLSKVLG